MKNFRRSIAILLVAVMTFVPTMASLADICAPEEHVYLPVKDEYDETIYYECEICDATVSNAEYEKYCYQENRDGLMMLTSLLGVPAPTTNWGLLANAMAGENQASVPGVFEVIEGDNERTIILYANIEAGAGDGTLNVPDDTSIVLRMNEHIIDANEGDFSVISVNPEASLSIIGPGKITGSKNSGNGGGIYNQGKLKLYWSVDIENNEAESGAGIYNEGDISADLCYYVRINNNIAENQGGGIYTSKYLLLDSKYSIKIVQQI